MRAFFISCLLACSSTAFAQSFWQPIPELSIPTVGERRIIPAKYQTMWLNLNAMQTFLTNVPERFTPAAEPLSILPLITLPTPEGRMSRFRLTESPVMAPELQAQYPEIRCYTGYGIDDPTAFLKCDLTPHGFHALVVSSAHGTYSIDPYSQGDRANYVVYYKKDCPRPAGQMFACGVQESKSKELTDPFQTPDQGSCQLRRYRLALGCTGEYAAFHGGTAALALSAMSTSVNNINIVYEDEVAVTMLLVANTNLLIFTNAGTDPYTNNDSGALLNENQTTCNNIIGPANYDIGHVFSTGGGGVASLGSVCQGSEKAKGVTGTSSPIGPGFDIDYVAHEMGHQFDGNHTFNGTADNCGGNENSSTAFEPGSGSTIMAYAGICSPQDVQSSSDPYFHAASLQEIGNFTATGTGNSCGTVINTSNNPPTVNGGPNYTIPKSTPFALTAVGSDPNNNGLTYNWEQRNSLASVQPPLPANPGGPNFRSFTAVNSPTRTFPAIDAVIGNFMPTWEVLPSVARNLSFRVTVRDLGAAYGCTEEDDVTVTVNAVAGPFVVTAPNTAVTWTINTPQTVTWAVANTATAPVNCSNVRISLSTDGGYNFPVVLAASTPNTGSAIVTPTTACNSCRVKIEGVGNIFFDMSNANFEIVVPLPVELMDFQARLEGENTALLSWATTSETNSRGFDIEMKNETDDVFQSVGFQAGKGTTPTKSTYQFRVNDLGAGTWQFRLKQLDHDGNFNYSPLRSVAVQERMSVKLFPNPVRGDLNLVFFQETEGLMSFELVNQLGQRFGLLSSRLLDKGFHNLQLPTTTLPAGVYYYLCYGENGILKGKIVVQGR